MINIFSIFDPIISINKSWNWIISLIILILIPKLIWILPNRFNLIWRFLIIYIIRELKVILHKKIYYLNFCTIFILIIITNFIGLFSYIFTSSRHLSITLSISLPIWLGFILFGWIFNANHIFTHQVPVGTPGILIPFIVLIEFIRNLIRPGTLSVRLTANIIAGHLLLTLISNNGPILRIIPIIILITTQRILIILEIRVSLIQAYVFTILTTLYSNEIN